MQSPGDILKPKSVLIYSFNHKTQKHYQLNDAVRVFHEIIIRYSTTKSGGCHMHNKSDDKMRKVKSKYPLMNQYN